MQPQPKIVFLGTAGDAMTASRQTRATGGIVIKVDGFQFHIDPGPGTTLMARQCGINLRENTAVLVSHAHLNHAHDVNAVLSAMTYNALDTKGVLIGTQSVIEGYEGIQPPLSLYFHKCVERILNVKPGQKIGIESIEIHSIKAFHDDPTAVGYKIYTPHFVVTYSGDTKYHKELLGEYANTDILILNCVHPFGKGGKDWNLSSDDVVTILKHVEPKLCIITHFGKAMLAADPICEAREIQRKTGVQIIAAKDGMVIQPESYSASLNQKTLNLYN
ncbi:MAG: MBL fold metallo-hydrolase [Candidatus Nanoarchaeia archaeon]